jgi:hypothetical protein
MQQTEFTQLVDAITPEIFNTYMNEYTAERSAFVQSGIAVADERVSRNITSGGLLVNMPFWTDLTGEDEVLGDGDKALQTSKITASNDIAAVMYRGKGWATNELVGVIAGSDPMQSLLGRIAAWWLRREQQVLISVLNGVFATGGALTATHMLDAQDKVIDGKMILDGKQLLGDAAERVNMIAMHSAVYTELQKQNLIEFIPNARGEVTFPTYLGYRVVVDDGIKADGNGVYTSYMFGTGSIGRNSGNPSGLTTFETDRDKAKGTDIIYTRRAITMHPYGIKWTDDDRESGNITPTNADLQKASNWKRVYEEKNIAIIAIKHRIEPLPETPETP